MSEQIVKCPKCQASAKSQQAKSVFPSFSLEHHAFNPELSDLNALNNRYHLNERCERALTKDADAFS